MARLRRIRMITRLAGPDGVRQPGQVLSTSEENAKLLVEGGFAAYVQMPQVEEAVLEVPEKAVARPPRKKRASTSRTRKAAVKQEVKEDDG